MLTLKAGVAAPIVLDTNPDRTDITAENIHLTYVESGTTNVPSDVTGFTHKGNGAYEYMLTINAVGYYRLAVIVPGNETYEETTINMTVLVQNASIDDVYTKLTTVDGKIDSIKTQVDLLDEASMNGLNDAITAVQNKLTDITTLINDENDPGVTSLKELLLSLSDSVGSSNNSLAAIQDYINVAVADIQNMIAGTELLQDGSPNPFYGNTNVDVMDSIAAMGVTLQQASDAAKTAVLDAITAAKNSLTADIADVETIVLANKALLENDVYGLGKLMTTLETVKSSATTNFTSLTNDLSSVSTSINDMHTAISSKLDSIETKVDTLTTITKRTQQTRIV